MQTYQGYFEDGRFVPLGVAKIPEHQRVILTVLDEPAPKPMEDEHAKAWHDFFEELAKCDEPLGPEFDEIMGQRINFTREIDL